MDLDQLKQILDLVREHELCEFEIEQEGLRLKIRRDAAGMPAPAFTAVSPAVSPVASMGIPTAASVASAPVGVSGLAAISTDTPPEINDEVSVVKSPIVGTFYTSADPGSPPFVEIGSAVKAGQVLCIIEAMKLMNEIDSEYDGEIVNIYVENGQPVQYGERLFAVKTR